MGNTTTTTTETTRPDAPVGPVINVPTLNEFFLMYPIFANIPCQSHMTVRRTADVRVNFWLEYCLVFTPTDTTTAEDFISLWTWRVKQQQGTDAHILFEITRYGIPLGDLIVLTHGNDTIRNLTACIDRDKLTRQAFTQWGPNTYNLIHNGVFTVDGMRPFAIAVEWGYRINTRLQTPAHVLDIIDPLW